MTVSTPDSTPIPTQSQVPDWEIENELDLRVYIDILISWWREILLLTLVPAFLTLLLLVALRILSGPSYEASAKVAIASVQSEVTFDERFRTQQGGGEEAVQQYADAFSRRAALVGLVQNGAIAQSVIDELAEQYSFTEDELEPINMLDSIEAELFESENMPANAKGASDLIIITATSDTPEKAAAIANAWGKHYVEEVNQLYGQMPVQVIASVQEELDKAWTDYKKAQSDFETFIAENDVEKLKREVEEKRSIISTLQTGKQNAISAILEEDLATRRQTISVYFNAQANHRLLAFNKEQEAKQQLLSAYLDAEIQSRLLAFNKDREARQALFDQAANAEIESKKAVFGQQVQDKINNLGQAYAQRNRLQNLLKNAELLKAQIEEGGDAAAQTNALALTLFKSQVFASGRESTPDGNRYDGGELPSNLQLDLGETLNGMTNAAEQLKDITALSNVLQTGITELDQEIQDQSEKLLTGDDYQFLDQLIASELISSAPITETLAAISQSDEQAKNDLSQAVIERYKDLFKVGGLAEINQEIGASSELFTNLEKLYPELFTLNDLSQLVEEIPEDNPLVQSSREKTKELLQLQGVEDVPNYMGLDTPLNKEIDKLEVEIQQLTAELEGQSARELQLTQERSLKWDTYTTLGKKVAEFNLAQNASNSEVRFATPAVPPIKPIPSNLIQNIILAGIVELMLALFVVFFAHYMGRKPFLNRDQKATAAA